MWLGDGTSDVSPVGWKVTTTVVELERWMGAPREDEHLEFKEAKSHYETSKLFAYCVALANEGGGKLVLGVTDRPPRRVVGSRAFPDTGDITEKILTKVRFRVDVEVVLHSAGRIVIFHIPSRPSGTAYQHEGAYLMRSGEQLVAMSEDRLRRIFDEGKPDWSLRPARAGLTPDDVVTLLDTQSFFDLHVMPYPSTRDAVLERFEHEKLAQRQDGSWTITNLGALLFAKRLDQFDRLSRKAPRVIVYEGSGKLMTKLDQPGTKGYAVGFEGLLEFINGQVPSNEVVEQALRRQVKMFPEIALRELVANAMIHQDLEDFGSPVAVEIFADRIEISNPGTPAVDPERFIDGYRSRNERLADLMRRLRICEEKGSGIDKVIAAVEAYQLPGPDFRVTNHRTVAVLFAHKGFDEMDRDERVRAAYQHCSLLYVMNQKMTNQSLRERFRLSESKAETVSRVIRDATNAGKIKLDDPESRSRRYARYVPFWA
jgi:ATP-dependent DNA helicase RecG